MRSAGSTSSGGSGTARCRRRAGRGRRRTPTTASRRGSRRRLDAAADASPDPGRPAVLHRLNRAEYRNAVRDLLALDVDVSSLLPPDTSSYGFDNIGDVLGLSPLLLESYLAAANRISRLAVASDSGVAVTADVYRVSTELTQRDRLDGLPFGTRGGTLVDHFFPVDGEYEIRVRLARNGASGNGGDIVGLNEPHQVEIAVDGARAGLLTAGANLSAGEDSDWSAAPQEPGDANLRVRVPVQAGPAAAGRLVPQTVLPRRSSACGVRSCARCWSTTGRTTCRTSAR